MPAEPDFFRDFGIHPGAVSPPSHTVRATFSTGQKVGQFMGSGLLSAVGVGLALLPAFGLPFPGGAIAGLGILACFGFLVYRVTRNDYAWVELKGETLRAEHLYTGRVVERPVEEIEELVTLVSPFVNAAVFVTEAWLGRIKGVQIKFRDQSTPIQVCRSDPAMRNAKELIQALVYRMAEKGEITAEVVDLEGAPLVRRVYWK